MPRPTNSLKNPASHSPPTHACHRLLRPRVDRVKNPAIGCQSNRELLNESRIFNQRFVGRVALGAPIRGYTAATARQRRRALQPGIVFFPDMPPARILVDFIRKPCRRHALPVLSALVLSMLCASFSNPQLAGFCFTQIPKLHLYRDSRFWLLILPVCQGWHKGSQGCRSS